jgi:lysyl-tRNA synthetase class 2
VRRAVRAFFDGEGFLEVETPARVPAPGQEVHLEAFPAGEGRYLVTSPEYHMKRLAAAGYPRIVQLGRAFRQGERGPHHQPEFTILEWYRVGAPLAALTEDCERILEAAARAVGSWPAASVPVGRGGPDRLHLQAPFERTTVRELLQRHAGVALAGDETLPELWAKAAAAGVACPVDAAWDDVFFQVFLDRIEPQLGRGRPTFVLDWPAPLAALARRRPDDPRVAERFELYAAGLELVNAFGELTDPAEQRARFVEERAIRAARGKTVYPIDEKLLAALGHLPPTSGAAMGFDRLVMLVTGAEDIREVIAFADDEI